MKKLAISSSIIALFLMLAGCGPTISYTDTELEAMLPKEALTKGGFNKSFLIMSMRTCLLDAKYIKLNDNEAKTFCQCTIKGNTEEFTLEEVMYMGTAVETNNQIPDNLVKKHANVAARCMRLISN
ncbi:MAG: hypothetical protein ACK502_02960 [Alphaproteobacteria bacterium]